MMSLGKAMVILSFVVFDKSQFVPGFNENGWNVLANYFHKTRHDRITY